MKKNKSIGTKERVGKLSSGNTGWPQPGNVLPCRKGFSVQILASAPAFEVEQKLCHPQDQENQPCWEAE